MNLNKVTTGDRNVPWLNQCRSSWNFKPIKYLCELNARVLPEDTDPNTEIFYIDIGSVNPDGSWTTSEPMIFNQAPSRARRVLRNGDVLISTVRTYLRAITYIDKISENFICSTGFAVLSAKKDVNPKFLAHWVRSTYFVAEIVARSVGVSYPAINATDIGNLPFPILSLDEQRTIAAFLDSETERIDTLITKKERQIELLQEKRTALISHAITRGLNPDVKMKDSGVEWMGEIPEHWEILAIKRITNVPITDGPHETPELLDEGIPFISAEAIKNDKVDFAKMRGYISLEDHAKFSRKYKPQRGDIYLIKSGATTGNVAFVDTDDEFNIWSPLAAIRPDSKKAITPFVFFFMKSKNFFQSIELGWSYGTQQNIGMNVIENIPIALPPLEEQESIAALLNTKTIRIDEIASKVKNGIDLLQEYRTTLISAAVTGKIDVHKEVA